MSEDKTLAKVNKMAHRFSENSTLTVAQIEREITALIQDRQTEAVKAFAEELDERLFPPVTRDPLHRAMKTIIKDTLKAHLGGKS